MTGYIWGIIIGIMWGVTNNIGMLLEKYVINKIPIEQRDKKFFRELVKNKIWLLGFSFDIGVSSLFFFLGQLLVGPTLLPGLGASGLIIMIIGSVKIINEKLKITDIIAIISLIIAIFLLGFSGLLIEVSNYDYTNPAFLLRSSIFMLITIGLIMIFEMIQKKSIKFRGLSLSIIAGFWAMIQTFVTSFTTAAMVPLFSGELNLFWLITIMIAGFLSFFSLALSIARMQIGFKYTDAHLAIPVREIPNQIGPAFVYILIFNLIPPESYSLPFLYISIVLIIMSSFLLGKKQAQLEEIDLKENIE